MEIRKKERLYYGWKKVITLSCTTTILCLSGCGREPIPPDTLQQQIVSKEEQSKIFPINEKIEAYIDVFGVPTIKKIYVLPTSASIYDFAEKTMVQNQVQYTIDSIVSPQNQVKKRIEKEQISDTIAKAKDFPKELKYNEVDGTGVLELDTDSIRAEINKNKKIPFAKSLNKTYTMAVKDQNKIPQTLQSGNITYTLANVSWEDIGDSGEGINGTNENDAYGTYNTVASSWKATAKYTGIDYTEDKNYKGTAVYIGTILDKNASTNTFYVTYKPTSPVENTGGIYSNRYIQSIYEKENAHLSTINSNNFSQIYHPSAYEHWAVKGFAILLLFLFFLIGSIIFMAIWTWKRANNISTKMITVHESVGTIDETQGKELVEQ